MPVTTIATSQAGPDAAGSTGSAPAASGSRRDAALATAPVATVTAAQTGPATAGSAPGRTAHAETSGAAPRLRWWALGVLCLSLLIIVVDTTIVNVAVPTLARVLHPTSSGLVWIVDAYTLVFAAMLLPAGALGDRYGRRRALLAGLAVFGAGSAGAALTTTATGLIAMRAVMGAGAAFIMPATLSLLAAVFTDPAERAKAIGIWSAVSGLGVALGPTVGGWLLERYSWSSIFWVNIPVVLAAIAGAAFLIPASRAANPARLDIPGALLAALAFAGLTYTLIQAPSAGWLSGVTLGRAAGSTVLLAAFVGWELRSSHPMVDLGLFRNRAFAAANVSVTVLFFGLSGITFVWTQILQFVMGYGTFAAGLRALPSAIVLMLVSPIGPRLAARFGIRAVVAAGLAVMAAGLALFTTAGATSSYPHFVVGMVIMSAGLGLALAPTTQAVMQALPPAMTGIGSAITNTTRNIGAVLGVAVAGSVATSLYTGAMPAAQVPPGPLGTAARQSVGAAATIARHLPGRGGQDLLTMAAHAFVHGADVGAWIAAAVALAAIPVAVTRLPRRAVSG